jgi:hypothetical protein
MFNGYKFILKITYLFVKLIQRNHCNLNEVKIFKALPFQRKARPIEICNCYHCTKALFTVHLLCICRALTVLLMHNKCTTIAQQVHSNSTANPSLVRRR